MKTVFSPAHARHGGQLELNVGELVPGFELPRRAEIVRARVEAVGLGPILPPREHGLETAAKVHRPDYLAFLPTAWERWTKAGRAGTAMAFAWPTHGLRGDRTPEDIDGLLGFYSFDAGATFVEGTWEAVKASHDVVLTAAELVESERVAFALCRPPGHHAGSGFAGGYCYINNAAVAAQRLLERGASRVAILDVDYHHGNGTQEIFYERADVAVFNVHADPLQEYPYFLGHADERGAGAGLGFNRNWPLRWGTAWAEWAAALEEACTALRDYAPDVVVVSLGVDTFERDPISKFKLTTDDFPKIGERIARLGLPTLFVMEGGYAVEEIGVNAVGVLSGFEEA
ncbi:MAG: acetylpolyamine amidohydrolase [Mesorhizobium amorphae]|nr:MAG: acetylpolyamine amidohydrolase [Mesorhizobium amorphae]